MISGIAGIRRAYQDADVARRYVENRFTAPLGALLHSRQTQALRRMLTTETPAEVLEIAPGPARLTREIADLPRRLTLLDASAQMLAEARRRLSGRPTPSCALIRGDAFQLPFGCSFDLVYSFRLIRHFGLEDRERLYREIARVLKPGGLLVFDALNQSVYAPLRARARNLEHYDASFTRHSLRAELSGSGFQVESLVGVQHQYRVLYGLQVYLAPRSARLARLAMDLVERIGAGEPLEWVVICRRV